MCLEILVYLLNVIFTFIYFILFCILYFHCSLIIISQHQYVLFTSNIKRSYWYQLFHHLLFHYNNFNNIKKFWIKLYLKKSDWCKYSQGFWISSSKTSTSSLIKLNLNFKKEPPTIVKKEPQPQDELNDPSRNEDSTTTKKNSPTIIKSNYSTNLNLNLHFNITTTNKRERKKVHHVFFIIAIINYWEIIRERWLTEPRPSRSERREAKTKRKNLLLNSKL